MSLIKANFRLNGASPEANLNEPSKEITFRQMALKRLGGSITLILGRDFLTSR